MDFWRVETSGLYLWLLKEETTIKWAESGKEYRYQGDILPELIIALD